METKSLALFMIAVIIGATGLAFGVYALMQVQTGAVNGDDGDDGDDGIDGRDLLRNIYYCSSQSEIETALDTIGTGEGTIVITDNITLSSRLEINDGGNYIIQGEDQSTLKCDANKEAFNITNVQSLKIKNLAIDTSDIASITAASGILVDEENDNPVYIQNVEISGGDGVGVNVHSENVWIEKCIINDLRYGIYLGTDSAYCHILDNLIYQMFNTSNDACGILLYSDKNTISGNIISEVSSVDGVGYGIFLSGSEDNKVMANNINDISSDDNNANGIYLVSSNNNTLMANNINDVSCDGSSNEASGIRLSISNGNTLMSNGIYDILSDDSSGYGIRIGTSQDNTIVGNIIARMNFDSTGGNLYGISLSGSHNNIVSSNTIRNIMSLGTSISCISLSGSNWNSISDNIIHNIWNAYFWAAGLFLSSSSEYNTFSGNIINDIYSGNGASYGIRIDSSDSFTGTGNLIYSMTSTSSIGYGIQGTSCDYICFIGNTLSICDTYISVAGSNNELAPNVYP